MIDGRNIVCIASSWFDHPTSKHHVMRLLSECNNVLWVNFHASRRPRLTGGDGGVIVRRLKQAWAGARRVAPRIDVLSPLLVPLPGSRAARFINARILGRQINAALRRLPRRPTQLWLFTPDIPEVVDRLKVERVVYYCVDDFAAFSGFNQELMERLERRTIAASDVVVTTAPRLYEPRRLQHPSVHLVPHGVDYEHFAAARGLSADAIPDDLKAIRGPIFGFMGLISDYVDLELIAQAARRRPEWSFVFLGDVRCDTAAVADLPNVHLLDGRPYEQLPAYCRGFDVGLIPFRMNRLVRAVNPIKLREYLAAGLPVVSSPLQTVLDYAPAVLPAETLSEFIPACERALWLAANTDPRDRQKLVRAESWAARVERLSEIVMNLAHLAECETPPDCPVPLERPAEELDSPVAVTR